MSFDNQNSASIRRNTLTKKETSRSTRDTLLHKNITGRANSQGLYGSRKRKRPLSFVVLNLLTGFPHRWGVIPSSAMVMPVDENQPIYFFPRRGETQYGILPAFVQEAWAAGCEPACHQALLALKVIWHAACST
jgi:hypothetical protein